MSELDTAIRDFPIVAWLSEHAEVQDRGGRNITLKVCPICGGNKTFSVWREPRVAHCFRCNEGGHGGSTWNGRAGLVRLVSILEHISFADSIKFIFERSGYPDPPVQARETPKRIFPEEAISLKGVSDSDPAVAYLKRRKIQHLQDEASVCLSGQYSGRIILPCRFLDKVIGFEAKSYTNQKPKALYPEWHDSFDQVHTTRFWDLNSTVCLITESIVDAETALHNAVGLFGGLKLGQINRLLDLKDRKIDKFVWCLDGDAWHKTKKNIVKHTLNLFRNFVVKMPKGEDPNSLGSEKLWELAGGGWEIKDEFDLCKADLEFS